MIRSAVRSATVVLTLLIAACGSDSSTATGSGGTDPDVGGFDAGGEDTGGEDTGGEDTGPPPTARAIAFTGAGGGVTRGSNVRAVIGFGAPQPMGTARSDSTTITVGPSAARP